MRYTIPRYRESEVFIRNTRDTSCQSTETRLAMSVFPHHRITDADHDDASVRKNTIPTAVTHKPGRPVATGGGWGGGTGLGRGGLSGCLPRRLR